MTVQLIMTQGSSAGTAAPIHRGYYLVGRHKECQIRPKSRSVSRRHCLLLHNEDGFGALDLKSTGGTFVNGKRLDPHQWCVLHHGDELRFGKVAFEVAINAPALTNTAAVGSASAAKQQRPQTVASRSIAGEEAPTSWQSLEMAEFLEAEEQLEYELQFSGSDAPGKTPQADGGTGDGSLDLSDDFDVLSEFDGGSIKPSETFVGDAIDLDEEAGEITDATVEVDPAPKKRPPRRQIDPKEYKRPPKRSFKLPRFSLDSADGIDWKLFGTVALVLATLGLFAYQVYRFQAGPQIEVRENLD